MSQLEFASGLDVQELAGSAAATSPRDTDTIARPHEDPSPTVSGVSGVSGASAPVGEVHSDALRFAQGQADLLAGYLKPGEVIEGFGVGGSESLTLFLRQPGGELIVRKILSERLVTPRWDRGGRGVMLPPHLKARRQMEFLRSLPPAVKPYFPRILGVSESDVAAGAGLGGEGHHEFIYDMTFVPGMEVSQFIRHHRPAPRTVALLYTAIYRLLREKLHAHRRRIPRGPTLETSYFTKIEQRLALAAATAPKTFHERLLGSEEIIINGRRLLNAKALLRCFRGNDRYREVLEPTFHALVAGDTNTENIKIGNIEPLLRDPEGASCKHPPFTAQDLELRFLDPRAIGHHEDGIDTGVDDPMYDNKPWHNSLGHYDLIHGEHFDLDERLYRGVPALRIEFHRDNPYAASYQGLEQHFAEVMTAAWNLDDADGETRRLDPYWIIRFAFLMGTHFMAMPPFHLSRTQDGELIDDAQHQGRPLAIYAEGIRWLNLTLDMLEGRIESYLGIPVPALDGAAGLRRAAEAALAGDGPTVSSCG